MNNPAISFTLHMLMRFIFFIELIEHLLQGKWMASLLMITINPLINPTAILFALSTCQLSLYGGFFCLCNGSRHGMMRVMAAHLKISIFLFLGCSEIRLFCIIYACNFRMQLIPTLI